MKLGPVRADRDMTTEGVVSPRHYQDTRIVLLSESVGLWILRLAWAGECMDFVQKLRKPAQALENGVGLLKMCLFVGTVSPGTPPLSPPPGLGRLEPVWPLCMLF